MPRQPASRVYLLILVCAFLGCSIHTVDASNATATPPPPPYYYEVGTFDPQGPNATCMTSAEVAAAYPSDWSDCARVVENQYDFYYVDSKQARRDQLMELLYIYSEPSSLACQQISFTLSCLLRFRPCVNVSYPAASGYPAGTLPVAKPICRNLCDIWAVDCGFAYDNAPEYVLFNCTFPDPNLWDNWTVPIFPIQSQTQLPIQIANSSGDGYYTYQANVPCFAGQNLSLFAPPVLCPSPLLPDPETGLCSFGCPLPVIGYSEYSTLEVIMDVFGWLSFILTAFLIASYVVDYKHKLTYPAILPLFFIFCINATSFCFCLGSMVGHEDIWCKNSAEPNAFGGGACTVQGIIWVYFTLAGVLWWLIIALNLAVMLFSVKFKNLMMRWYHVYHVVWCLPVITLIISLANEVLGYGGDVWCSVHIGPPTVKYQQTVNGVVTVSDTSEYLWNLLLIIVPIFVMVFIGIIALLIVLVYMAINVKTMGWKYLAGQWRLVVFLMFYIYIYVFVFAFQIELIVQKNDQYSSYQDYINCLYLALFNPTLDCTLEQYVNFPLWVIVTINASAQGCGVFLIFGTSKQIYVAWLRLFQVHRLFPILDSSTGSRSTSVTKIQGKKVGTTNSISRTMMDDEELETSEVGEEMESKSEEEEASSKKESENSSTSEEASDKDKSD